MAGFQEENYIAVVAIDFGTSFSGFAFAFNHSDGESGVYMNKAWGYDVAFPDFKTPTCLLLKPDMTFDRFGHEAQEKYACLENTKEQKSFHYFERFKMVLHGNKSLDRKTTIKAKNGKSFPAKEVFALSIAFLKDKALETLKERTDTDYTVKDIKWVITVPAIWKPPAKQFMREAAESAELFAVENPDQLVIALEPEAAGIYCRQLKMSQFVKERGDDFMRDTVAKERTRYLVCDIGGGTLDMTAYEILKNDDIKEIHHATGGALGGTKVDAKFEKLMEVFVGKDLMDEFRNTHPSEWLEIMTDWEMKKRSTRAVEGEVTRVKMSYGFVNFYEHRKSAKGKRSFLKLFTRQKELPVPYDEVSLSNGHLSLDPTVMKALFKEVISSIICEIKEVLKKSFLADKINCIFLVGGFSDCKLLQDAVREAFEATYRVLVPEYASLAVVKGAVIFGQKPTIVTGRALAETYGVGTHMAFEECDPEEKCIVVEGVRKCADRFSLLAKVGDVVEVGECRTHTFYPLYQDQTQVKFEFFTTERLDIPRYTDEDGVKKLQGHVTIDCPIRPGMKDRELELKMYFGGTEIQVIATDLKSGKGASAYIDFLAKKR